MDNLDSGQLTISDYLENVRAINSKVCFIDKYNFIVFYECSLIFKPFSTNHVSQALLKVRIFMNNIVPSSRIRMVVDLVVNNKYCVLIANCVTILKQ